MSAAVATPLTNNPARLLHLGRACVSDSLFAPHTPPRVKPEATRKPPGLGAARLEVERRLHEPSGRTHNRVGERADTVDFYLDVLADLQRTDAGGRPGEDDVADLQGHHLADEGDSLGDVEDEVV